MTLRNKPDIHQCAGLVGEQWVFLFDNGLGVSAVTAYLSAGLGCMYEAMVVRNLGDGDFAPLPQPWEQEWLRTDAELDAFVDQVRARPPHQEVPA